MQKRHSFNYKLVKIIEMNTEKILKEIDEMHLFSKESLEQKRFNDYISVFLDDLTYKQLNGRVIDKMQLAKDTNLYFSRLKSSTSQFERKDYSINGNRFTENLIQKSTASIKVFFFFIKKWTIEREGIYEWIHSDGNWRIEKVEILSEKVF
jgi:hypothetical protein